MKRLLSVLLVLALLAVTVPAAVAEELVIESDDSAEAYSEEYAE